MLRSCRYLTCLVIMLAASTSLAYDRSLLNEQDWNISTNLEPALAAEAISEKDVAANNQTVCDWSFAAADPTSPSAPDNMIVLASTAQTDDLAVLALAGQTQDPWGVDPAASQPAEYVPWKERIGPAYPCDKWRSIGRDLQELPLTLWDDTKHTFTDPIVLGGLGVASVAGVVLNLHVDNTVNERTAHGKPHLRNFEDYIGNNLGNPITHFVVAAGLYTIGLECEDTKLYETSKALFNALVITGVTTEVGKVIVNDHSPDRHDYAWPSGHSSSSFATATVLAEAYGPCVGVPLYAFATFVGYERIDSRRHNFSDVISGMVIGIVIGHSVAQNHMPKICGWEVQPTLNPETNSAGAMLSKRW